MSRYLPLFSLISVLAVACDAMPAEDPPEIRARYAGRFTGQCNTWVKSPLTGQEYCSSPPVGWSNDPAYAPVASPVATGGPSPFDGFDTKSADEKKAVLMAEGEKTYRSACGACHQPEGQGLAPTFPPLAGDPVANGGPVEEHITTVLNGLSGKAINGVTYTGAMTPFAAQLSDEQIAAVITFERNSWGNNGGVVEPAQVKALRK